MTQYNTTAVNRATAGSQTIGRADFADYSLPAMEYR
jgi:hypothetical protein